MGWSIRTTGQKCCIMVAEELMLLGTIWYVEWGGHSSQNAVHYGHRGCVSFVVCTSKKCMIFEELHDKELIMYRNTNVNLDDLFFIDARFILVP